MTKKSVQAHVQATLEKIREPMGLDRWTFRVSQEKCDDSRAYCAANPEYRDALIVFDMDKLLTGDELDEITVHEATHCLTWEMQSLAEELANALADSMPESHREAMRKMLMEKVRQAGERVTTDVGHALLRLFRRAQVLDTPPVDA